MRNDDGSQMTTETDLQPVVDRLGAVAAQLVDAACHAWNGDGESVKAGISHALALLGNDPGPAPPPPRPAGSSSRRVFRGGLASWQARRLVTYIDANLTARVFLGDLARLAGLSNGHLCRAFKQTFGVSAHNYLMRRRIEFAQGAMLKTRMPLSEIALTCGLSDQSHFTRAFRRLTGETPHAWRRARRDALDDVQAPHAAAPGAAVPGSSTSVRIATTTRVTSVTGVPSARMVCERELR
jgi:AraC-like DNA-binding protein